MYFQRGVAHQLDAVVRLLREGNTANAGKQQACDDCFLHIKSVINVSGAKFGRIFRLEQG